MQKSPVHIQIICSSDEMNFLQFFYPSSAEAVYSLLQEKYVFVFDADEWDKLTPLFPGTGWFSCLFNQQFSRLWKLVRLWCVSEGFAVLF